MRESSIRRNLQPRRLLAGADTARGFTYGVQVGQTVWISGQVARNEQGELIGAGDLEAQAIQVMENVKAVVEEAGGTMGDIVKISTYVTDQAFREPVQAVRRRYFRTPNLPASATIVADMLVPGALVEVEAVAVIGSAIKDQA